jgi:glucose/arabinose dehydrogenase
MNKTAKRSIVVAALVGLLALLAAGSSQAGISAGVQATPVGNFNTPVYVTSAPGRSQLLFVVQQGGKVKVLKNGENEGTFLDLSKNVSTGYTEQGLLSIAFPPEYRETGRFYVYFNNRSCSTSTTGCNIEIDQYRVQKRNPLRARPGTRRKVLEIQHKDAPNHNGGTAVFGPDGKLWIGTGDGGAGDDVFDNASRTNKLLGKLLRIDPRRDGKKAYRIPADNPYAGSVPGRGEIWASGLRNPFRFSFDQNTGDLAIGDVGQNVIEEADYVSPADAKGNSFGWSAREGDIAGPNPDRVGPGSLIEPVATYDHTGGRCAITGGVVANDPRLQGSLAPSQGRYLYADFCSGPIESIRTNDGDPPQFDAPESFDLQISNPSSFGTDQQQRIYVTSLNGTVYRLDPAN